jgi:hypothetical protein
MVEISIKKHDLLGTFEELTIDGVEGDPEDFGTVEISGDCSSGVCHIVRRFIPFDATPEVYAKYGIDQNGYEEICTRLADEVV